MILCTPTNKPTLNQDHVKALNQLCSVLAGGNAAKATNHLSDDPASRVEECLRVALADLSTAVLDRDERAQRQAQRKIESLQSLQVIATALT